MTDQDRKFLDDKLNEFASFLTKSRKIKYRNFTIEKQRLINGHEWVYYSDNSGGETTYTDNDLNYVIDHIDELILESETENKVL